MKLEQLFHDTLKDIYFAERQILKALPKMIKAAQNPTLKEGLVQLDRQWRTCGRTCFGFGGGAFREFNPSSNAVNYGKQTCAREAPHCRNFALDGGGIARNVVGQLRYLCSDHPADEGNDAKGNQHREDDRRYSAEMPPPQNPNERRQDEGEKNRQRDRNENFAGDVEGRYHYDAHRERHQAIQPGKADRRNLLLRPEGWERDFRQFLISLCACLCLFACEPRHPD